MLFFRVWFFYPTARGIEYKYFWWQFEYAQMAEHYARKYAERCIPNCTKIVMEWDCGTEKKKRTLRKDTKGKFHRGRN